MIILCSIKAFGGLKLNKFNILSSICVLPVCGKFRGSLFFRDHLYVINIWIDRVLIAHQYF